MPLPVLKSACGCGSVKVGAKVLAWMDIVCYTLKIVSTICRPPTRQLTLRLPPHFKSINNGHIATQVDDLRAPMDSPMLVFPISLVMITADVFLLIGIEMRRKNYLVPYLVLKGLGCVVIAILVIIFLDWFVVADKANGNYFTAAIFLGLLLALNIYFWLWVYSVHQKLQENEADIDFVKYTCPPPGMV